jgi:hypothetical protein
MEVTLVKQSYYKAKRSGAIKGDMRLLGLVSGTSSRYVFCKEAIDEVNSELVKKARELSASHVFGVEYKARDVSVSRAPALVCGGTIGYGDAFRKD